MMKEDEIVIPVLMVLGFSMFFVGLHYLWEYWSVEGSDCPETEQILLGSETYPDCSVMADPATINDLLHTGVWDWVKACEEAHDVQAETPLQ